MAGEQAVYELMAQHEHTVSSIEDMGWTAEEIIIWPEARVIGADLPTRVLSIEAVATIGGDDIRYTISICGDRWAHDLDGVGPWGGAYRHSSAGVIASPEAAHRLLCETNRLGREWSRSHLESEVYKYLLASCGPGEEPDSEEFERLTEEYWSGDVVPGYPEEVFGEPAYKDDDFDELFVVSFSQGVNR